MKIDVIWESQVLSRMNQEQLTENFKIGGDCGCVKK